MKEYGPMNALKTDDGSSCWYSDGQTTTVDNNNSQQSFVLHFKRIVRPHTVKIQFQAGFSASTCQLQLRNQAGVWEILDDIELEDTHHLQSFPLPTTDKEGDAIQLLLDDYADFYGRIMIYRLEIWGTECISEG
jgi:hypothetical protein